MASQSGKKAPRPVPEVVIDVRDEPMPDFRLGEVLQRQVRNIIRRRRAAQKNAKQQQLPIVQDDDEDDDSDAPLAQPRRRRSSSSGSSSVPLARLASTSKLPAARPKPRPKASASPLKPASKAQRLFRRDEEDDEMDPLDDDDAVAGPSRNGIHASSVSPDAAAAPSKDKGKQRALFRGSSVLRREEDSSSVAASADEAASGAASEAESIPRTRASLVRPKAYAKRTAPVTFDESASDSGLEADTDDSASMHDSPSPPPPPPKPKPAPKKPIAKQSTAAAASSSKQTASSSKKRASKRPATPPPKTSKKKKKQSKASTSAATAAASKEQKGKKRKRHAQASPSSDDLEVDLNERAFVKSTGGGQKAAMSKKLAQLKRARLRKQGIEPSDETESSSSSDSSSDSDGSDSDSAATSSFVRSDDNEDEPAQPPNPYSPRKYKSGSRPLQDGAQDSLKDLGFVRQSHDDNVKDYIKWVIIRLLDMDIPPQRKPQLERARKALQELVKAAASVLRTQTMRKEFYWHLRHYPNFERVHAADEGRKGCMACKNPSHVCDSRFTFSGRFYNPQTLSRLTPEEYDDTSSSCSSGLDDTFAIKSGGDDPSKRKRTFYLGSFCANRARFLHMAAHWEFQATRRIKKGKAFTAFDAKIQRLKRDPREDEIEEVVAACAPALQRRIKHMQDVSEKINYKKGKYGYSLKSAHAHDYSKWVDDEPIPS